MQYVGLMQWIQLAITSDFFKKGHDQPHGTKCFLDKQLQIFVGWQKYIKLKQKQKQKTLFVLIELGVFEVVFSWSSAGLIITAGRSLIIESFQEVYHNMCIAILLLVVEIK